MTAIAASGLRARMESLDLLANNVANASTGGYKADREFYSLYVAPEALDSDSASTMPVIERPWIDLSQGVVQATGNPLDLALSGNGFFSVAGAGRNPLYAQRQFSPGGRRQAGHRRRLCRARRGRRQPDPAGVAPGRDRGDGTVQQDGNVVGQLEVADFTSCRPAWPSRAATTFASPTPRCSPSAPAGTAVEQGKLEASNTGSAEAAVRLVSVMRQFEMLQKAVSLGADMNKQAIEQVAKSLRCRRDVRRSHDSSTLQRRQRHEGAGNQRGQHRQQPGQRQHRGLQDAPRAVPGPDVPEHAAAGDRLGTADRGSRPGLQLGLGTRATSNEIVFTQGAFTETDNPLDLVIQGNGFFQVRQPTGDLAYTRAGQFQLDKNGNIVTSDGNPLEPQITIPADAQQVTIAADGTVSYTLPNQTAASRPGRSSSPTSRIRPG